jgi:hypothetical protein
MSDGESAQPPPLPPRRVPPLSMTTPTPPTTTTALPPPHPAAALSNSQAQRSGGVSQGKPAQQQPREWQSRSRDAAAKNEKAPPAAPDNRRVGDFSAGEVSPAARVATAATTRRAGDGASERDGGASASASGAAEPASLRDALVTHKIALASYATGQQRVQCPVCRGGSVRAGERAGGAAAATRRWLRLA